MIIGSRTSVLIAVLCAACSSCVSQKKVVYKPPPLTAEEREEVQMRILDGSFDAAFAATIAVLQDEAWNLTEVNKEGGVIQAETKRRRDDLGPGDDWQRGAKKKKKAWPSSSRQKSGPSDEVLNKWTRWEKLTAHIESWGAGKVRERISIVKHGSLPAVTYSYKVGSFSDRKVVNVNEPAREDQALVEEPLIYGQMFGRIERAMATRKDL
ncbi:MAG: hypothetical protein JXB04_10315 [Kiritimatiellae bacterium]|nr:hypothetical protein [Kiritimatiellia bacterium]